MDRSGSNTVRVTAASNVLERLELLNKRADNIASKIDDKLSVVTRMHIQPPDKLVDTKQEEMPLLFANMREIIISINEALTRIEGTIERLEL